MGVDYKYISQVIHFGGSRNIESYLQEYGRAGRNSELSTCYLLYNGILMKRCDEDMKNYVFSKSCRRKEIKSIFPNTQDAECIAKVANVVTHVPLIAHVETVIFPSTS